MGPDGDELPKSQQYESSFCSPIIQRTVETGKKTQFIIATEEFAMLVLNRKLGERVFICKDIVVTVVGVHGGRVKLGFDCPGHIPVHREEVYQRIHQEPSPELPRAQAAQSRFIPEFA